MQSVLLLSRFQTAAARDGAGDVRSMSMAGPIGTVLLSTQNVPASVAFQVKLLQFEEKAPMTIVRRGNSAHSTSTGSTERLLRGSDAALAMEHLFSDATSSHRDAHAGRGSPRSTSPSGQGHQLPVALSSARTSPTRSDSTWNWMLRAADAAAQHNPDHAEVTSKSPGVAAASDSKQKGVALPKKRKTAPYSPLKQSGEPRITPGYGPYPEWKAPDDPTKPKFRRYPDVSPDLVLPKLKPGPKPQIPGPSSAPSQRRSRAKGPGEDRRRRYPDVPETMPPPKPPKQ